MTKRYDFTESFQSVAGGVALQTFRLRHPLRESELEDATGAGDVFAAAVLSSLTSARLKIELGAYLGLKLAQFKAVQTAPSEFTLPDLSRGFLERVDTLNTAEIPAAQGVFLVHHDSPYRTVVRRFIEQDCGLPVYEMTSADIAGSGFAALLGEQAPRCGFAVRLLGRTETMADGRARADQNVVYQAGFFHGRYGFGRVALLSEEGFDVVGIGALNLDYVASNSGTAHGRPFTRRLAELLGHGPGAAGGRWNGASSTRWTAPRCMPSSMRSARRGRTRCSEDPPSTRSTPSPRRRQDCASAMSASRAGFP